MDAGDLETGELSYNIEDPDHPLLPTGEPPSEAAQLDPSQQLARTQGRSPAAMLPPRSTVTATCTGMHKLHKLHRHA